jgi:DNA-binding NarL/FixJ family response regulator
LAPQRELPVDSSKFRLLVLNEDTTLIQSLSRVLQPNLSKLTLDSASSPSRAQLLFDTSTYHAIICSPGLMFVDGRSFLTRSRAIQPPMPFLLMLKPDERRNAQEWMDLGVYDFIFCDPLDPSQALESVQDALVLSKRRAHIVQKERVLVHLRQRRERYLLSNGKRPLGRQVDGFINSSIARIEESTEAFKETVNRIEASLKALQRACHSNELQARQRALNRLKTDLLTSL